MSATDSRTRKISEIVVPMIFPLSTTVPKMITPCQDTGIPVAFLIPKPCFAGAVAMDRSPCAPVDPTVATAGREAKAKEPDMATVWGGSSGSGLQTKTAARQEIRNIGTYWFSLQQLAAGSSYSGNKVPLPSTRDNQLSGPIVGTLFLRFTCLK